jgi:hypothetical protein
VLVALAEIHHFGPPGPENAPMDRREFVSAVERMSAGDIRGVAASLDAESVADEVDWWRATIAIDRALRFARCSRQAASAASEANAAVERAAARGDLDPDDPVVGRVARAAADVARGIVAGPSAAPIVRLLLAHWGPVVVTV